MGEHGLRQESGGDGDPGDRNPTRQAQV